MACFYIIKLPAGGEIKVPASSGKFQETDTFKDDLNIFWNAVSNLEDQTPKSIRENLKEEIKNLVDEVKVYIPDNFMRHATIESLVVNSNPGEDLVAEINKRLPDEIEKDTVETAISKYLNFQRKRKLSSKELSIKDILKEVSIPVVPAYFNNVEFLNVVGKTSVDSEIKRLNLEESDMVTAGLDPITQTATRSFINSVFSLDRKKAKTLIGISAIGSENNTLIIPSTDSTPEFIIYENGDELSLFLASFKSMITNLPLDAKNALEQKILGMLSEYNKKVKSNPIDLADFSLDKFMIGEFNEGTSFKEGDFHKLFNTTSGIGVIDKIIENAIQSANVKDIVGTINAAKILFSYIDPKKYGRALFTDVNDASFRYRATRQKDEVIRNTITARKASKMNTYSERDYHYSTTKKITGDVLTVKNKLFSSIDLGKDLVFLPTIADKGLWVTATKIVSTTDGLYVYGVREIGEKLDPKGGLFAPDSQGNISVSTKTLETAEAPEIFASVINKSISGVTITSTDGLDPDLVSKYTVRGSSISYKKKDGTITKAIVQAIYPGKIVLDKKDGKTGKLYELGNFSNITSLTTPSIAVTDAMMDGQFTNWSDDPEFADLHTITKDSAGDTSVGLFASKGDYILYHEVVKDVVKTRINKVAFTDPENVYIMIRYANGNASISKVSRDKVEQVKLKSKFIDSAILAKISDFYFDTILAQNSMRGQPMSYSENLEKSRNGDYIISDGAIFEIIDKENNKYAYRYDTHTKYEILAPEEIQGFFTTRDVSSDFAYYINKVNSSKIIETPETTIRYIIPQDQNLEDLVLFDFNYLNSGSVQDKNQKVDKGFKDVTEDVIKLISKRDGKKVKGLSFDMKNKTSREKVMEDLHPISYFEKLSRSTLTEALQVGAYIKIKNNNNSVGNHLFRVDNIAGDIVTLEYSTFSYTGNLLTVSKNMSMDSLINNLTNLYLIKGNNKIPKIINEIGIMSDNTLPELTSKQAVITLGNNLEKYFKDLKVTYVEGGGFENGQYAKIQNGEIVINLKDAQKHDVLHEFLHVMLIGMKYNNYEKYEDFLLTYKADRLAKYAELKEKTVADKSINTILNNARTLEEIEESFVKEMSKIMSNQSDIDINSFERFKDVLVLSLNNFGIETDAYFNDLNVVEMLSTKLKDIIHVKETSPIFDNSLLMFDAEYRTWLDDLIKENKLEINCK